MSCISRPHNQALEEREILIDTHSAPVCDAVWSLYEFALDCFGPLPT